MLVYIILNIIIALVTILLLHHIWNYLKENYSTKKTKDLAEFQAQKYKDIFLTITADPPSPVREIDISRENGHPLPQPQPQFSIEWLSPGEEQWMIKELEGIV